MLIVSQILASGVSKAGGRTGTGPWRGELPMFAVCATDPQRQAAAGALPQSFTDDLRIPLTTSSLSTRTRESKQTQKRSYHCAQKTDGKSTHPSSQRK